MSYEKAATIRDGTTNHAPRKDVSGILNASRDTTSYIQLNSYCVSLLFVANAAPRGGIFGFDYFG